MSPENRGYEEQRIASLLGYDPTDVGTWNHRLINNLLQGKEEVGERWLRECIQQLTSK